MSMSTKIFPNERGWCSDLGSTLCLWQNAHRRKTNTKMTTSIPAGGGEDCTAYEIKKFFASPGKGKAPVYPENRGEQVCQL